MTDTTTVLQRSLAAFGPDARAHDAEVLDSTIHWVESGTGNPIVFIHGNPTSSYLWRHIFAGLAGHGRLLAVDLIGFGQSGKPDIDYSLDDHQRYLDAWLDSLDLHDVTFVIQDYGSTFGISWARRHADRVRSIVFFEPIIRPIPSQHLDPAFISLRSQVLQPGLGEEIVLEQNRFVTELLPNSVINGLSEEDQAVYQAAFPTPESRRPVLVCPRALPVDGAPASTVAILAENEAWLVESSTPKLLLTFEPGFLLTPDILEWSRENIANLTITAIGPGGHWAQEDQPAGIANAVSRWLSTLS